VRTFVAVEIPDHLRIAVRDSTATLRRENDRVRWVPPENMHLTLKFLGEINERQLREVQEATAEAAKEHPPFELSLGPVGAFPNLSRPRVVWIGLQGGVEALGRLASCLENLLERRGFARERRPFRAHLTLGRARRPGPLEGVSAVTVPTGSFLIESVVVMESQLRPQGAQYRVIDSYPLGQNRESQED
jgi:2'-5' RNA ligase